jgi:hypothetical protein
MMRPYSCPAREAHCYAAKNEGLSEVTKVNYLTSRIPRWQETGLDTQNGAEYKPGPLYMEGTKG